MSLFSKQIPAYVIGTIMCKLFFYKGYYSETESNKLGVTVYDLSGGKMRECSWPMFDKNLAWFQSETEKHAYSNRSDMMSMYVNKMLKN